jgi:glycosyltransferase involved in cell wall biosynthesis
MISISNDKIIHLIPNAVDSSLVNYQNFKLSPRQGPIVIGYIGHLTEAWFDWESVIKIADKNKNWEFQIIGHSLPDKILLPSNIKYIGRKKPQEFKDLTKKWRAAIIPFKISKLADCVDPIKVYEYLALGLPVVSFRMPQIDNYPFVYTANNVEEFEKKLNEAIYTNLNKPIILEFLINNTWEKRALQFLHLIEHKNNI